MLSDLPAELAPGTHACLHFTDDGDRKQVLTSYFLAGAQQHQKLVYLTDDRRLGDVAHFLSPFVASNDYLDSGQLVAGNALGSYLEGGYFDPYRCVASFRRLAKAAVAEGYSGLRVYADNDLLLPKLDSATDWVDYEMLVAHMTPTMPIIGMCGFDHRSALGLPASVLDAVHLHSCGNWTPELKEKNASRPSTYWVAGTPEGATAIFGEVDSTAGHSL